MFKVAAQIPIMRELSLGTVVFGARHRASDRPRRERTKTARSVKLDLRETSGPKRLMRGVTVEALLSALSPDDVTWPDGAVGRVIQLGADFQFGGTTFAKGTKFVVTRVETEPKAGESRQGGHPRDRRREARARQRGGRALKQNGAIGTAERRPK